MQITDLSVTTLDFTKNPLQMIYLAGNTCYNKGNLEDIKKQMTTDKAYNLTRKLIQNNHLSVLEHINFNFYIENLSRSCLAQLTRHRVGISFSVKSQHYILHDDFNIKDLEVDDANLKLKYFKFCKEAKNFYNYLIKENVPRFIAREVLPNAVVCNVFMTINLRALIHLLKLRQGPENTPEIRLLSNLLLKELKLIDKTLYGLIIDGIKNT